MAVVHSDSAFDSKAEQLVTNRQRRFSGEDGHLRRYHHHPLPSAGTADVEQHVVRRVSNSRRPSVFGAVAATAVHQISSMSTIDTIVEHEDSNYEPIKKFALSDTAFQDEEEEKENKCATSCNFFGYRPAFLQRLANVKVFLLCMVFQGTFSGALHSYQTGVLSTIVKRFRLPITALGTISSIGEIGEIGCIFFVAHYGGSGHRPRWIAVGTLILAVAALLAALPEFFAPSPAAIYTDGSAAASPAAAFASGDGSVFMIDGHQSSETSNVSMMMPHPHNTANVIDKRSARELCHWEDRNFSRDAKCHYAANSTDPIQKVAYIPPGSWVAVILMTASSVFQNIGTSFMMVLPLPYIHDNVDVRSSPIYYSLFFLGRVGGPLLGSGLSSVFTSIYVNPISGPPPGVGRSDPKWIGAWHLGYIVIAITLVFSALMLSMFPRRMPYRARKGSNAQSRVVVMAQISQAESDTEKFNTYMDSLSRTSTPTEEDEDQKSHTSNNTIMTSIGTTNVHFASEALETEQQQNSSATVSPVNRRKSPTRIRRSVLKVEEKPRADKKRHNNYLHKTKACREFPRDLWRVLTNTVVMLRALAGAMDAFVFAGYFKYLMIYAEIIFRYPPWIVTLALGATGISAASVGAVTGAVVIRRYKLQPKHISFLTFAAHIVITVLSLVQATFNCGEVKYAGLDVLDHVSRVHKIYVPHKRAFFRHFLSFCARLQKTQPAASTPSPNFTTLTEFLNLPPYSNCSSGTLCHCSTEQLDFDPVCDISTNLTYFSACHAGCSRAIDPKIIALFFRNVTIPSTLRLYGNCSCSAANNNDNNNNNTSALLQKLLLLSAKTQAGGNVHKSPLPGLRIMRSGKCGTPCAAIFGYIACLVVMGVVMALPSSGAIMILYRIVEPDLKSMAQGVQSFLTSGIAFMPAPIIMGALFDSACRLWNTQTDQCTGASSLGNCLVYESNALRWRYHLFPVLLRVLSTICDFVIFWKVRHLTFETEQVANP